MSIDNYTDFLNKSIVIGVTLPLIGLRVTQDTLPLIGLRVTLALKKRFSYFFLRYILL